MADHLATRVAEIRRLAAAHGVGHVRIFREGVLASVEIRVATPQNVETPASDLSKRRRNHPCGRYDGFGDKGKTWN